MSSEELTIYEEEISETSGLSSINQIVDKTSNDIFSFLDIVSTGGEILNYFPVYPIFDEKSEKEEYLKEFRSLIKDKIREPINFKELYYDQLKQKYKDVF